ncbi:MAG: hypothetical protein IPL79_04330 [Myxococcales bacterium]|nr:hypothetical protein [Myxococcales bacterium]
MRHAPRVLACLALALAILAPGAQAVHAKPKQGSTAKTKKPAAKSKTAKSARVAKPAPALPRVEVGLAAGAPGTVDYAAALAANRRCKNRWRG